MTISKILLFPLKLLKWLFLGLICSALLSLLVPLPAEGLTDLQRGAISQNCGSIQQTLEQLQRIDSRTRTYLGTTYETIANHFIVPLNLRLVKNNRPTLASLQTEYIAAQSIFKTSYTTYMRELEQLIATDCRTAPDDFYDQLVTTRSARSVLSDAALELNGLAEDQYQAVLDLRSSL